MIDTQQVVLKKGADRRIKGGHLWIYSNEIDTRVTPIKQLEVGDAIVVNEKGKPLGRALINPKNLICGRIYTRDAEEHFDEQLIAKRLRWAQSLREPFYSDQCYRWVYGDSDFLPGLVVDRFGEYLSVQVNHAALEPNIQAIVDVLADVSNAQGIVLRNDGKAREAEGLESYVENINDSVPEWVDLVENGVSLQAPVLKGQKTGWFYDHRDNRAKLKELVKGKRVLDLFSYVGGWGVQAAAFGAEEVVCVDASEYALSGVERNAELNGVGDKVRVEKGNVFEITKAMAEAGERFDVVIADPPALIKKRKDLKSGTEGYHRVNQLALRLTKAGGILVSGSCSMHMTQDSLIDVVRVASRHVDRHAQLIYLGDQGSDHPIHPAIPETRYLKALFMRSVLL